MRDLASLSPPCRRARTIRAGWSEKRDRAQRRCEALQRRKCGFWVGRDQEWPSWPSTGLPTASTVARNGPGGADHAGPPQNRDYATTPQPNKTKPNQPAKHPAATPPPRGAAALAGRHPRRGGVRIHARTSAHARDTHNPLKIKAKLSQHS